MTDRFTTDEEYGQRKKITKREQFLDTMDAIIPWAAWIALIAPYYPDGKRGRPPVPIETMLRMYLLQIWFNLSDPGTEEAIYDSYAFRKFMKLNFAEQSVPDETTLLHFRHLLEKHDLNRKFLDELVQMLKDNGTMMQGGSIVDATIINAPSSTKNAAHERDPEMHSAKKGSQWYFGMKAHIGVDAGTGLVHSATFTAANVSDIAETVNLVRGNDEVVYGDAGYGGIEKRDEVCSDEHLRDIDWRIAAKRGTIKKLSPIAKDWEVKIEHMKSSVRAKVEHVFRIIKQQFGFTKTPYRGIAKNANRILGMLATANLYMLAQADRTLA